MTESHHDTLKSLEEKRGPRSSFRMPAEWEPHAECWMGWPERVDNWHSDAAPAQAAFLEVATVISSFEPVTMCASAREWQRARQMLPQPVRVAEMSMNDSWLRDNGPTFVVKEVAGQATEVAGIDWTFNGWGGGVYSDFRDDTLVAFKVLNLARVPRVRRSMVLEGGSIHTDGEGTLLTTEECLLHPNRNPHLNRGEIEEELRTHLGVEKILWLPRGLFGDVDTNGHVDNMACFARPGVILLSWIDDEADPQHAISLQALHYLSTARDARGREVEVVKLHVPGPLFYTREEIEGLGHPAGSLVHDQQSREVGQRLAASYVNFYIANGAVVVPQFGEKRRDAEAVETLSRVFPDRKLVPIMRGRDIAVGGGNIHCITQQQPMVPTQKL